MAADVAAGSPLRLYIGTRTGVYAARFDPGGGSVLDVALAAESDQATFLALHPGKPLLYAVGARPGRPGCLRAFARDDGSGRLAVLNEVHSGGVGPCHLAVDRAGTSVLAANYRSGSVAGFPLGADGRLGEAAAVMQHAGSSVNAARQEGPHAHSVTLDPDNRFVLAADLGLDRIVVYRFEPGGRLAPHDPPGACLAPGSGPRHLAFDPAGRRVYVLNELASTVTAFRYDPARGALAAFQTVSALPASAAPGSMAAEIRVHPTGRWVYASNRGHDSLAVFDLDPADGTLTLAIAEPCRGAWPRHFTLTPDGAWLLAANERSDSVTVFRVDPATGRLAAIGLPAPVPAPVCLVWAG